MLKLEQRGETGQVETNQLFLENYLAILAKEAIAISKPTGLLANLLFLVGLRVVNIPFGRLIECCTYDVNLRGMLL
jgi:hypothetical protein